MMTPRLIEQRMLILLRQGKISKWFSGIGQEAISVGATYVLHQDELIFPMHRNLGVFTGRGIPLHRLFAQWQGKAEGFTKGRDRSFHFGTLDYQIVGMISHLGPQLSLGAGAALAYKLQGEPKVSLAFTGEGGTSQGEFHEALNVAAVWSLPVIFMIENNGYGLSTPTSQQYACQSLSDRGIGYGIETHKMDGNNILEVVTKLSELTESVRQDPRPILIEAVTFRMRGHEEASGTKYVPEELMEHWAAKDPLDNFVRYLQEKGIVSDAEVDQMQSEINQHILEELAKADAFPQISSSPEQELADVYDDKTLSDYPHTDVHGVHDSVPDDMRFVDALGYGLDQAMQEYDDLVLMGQDIADYGGVFKITDGFLDKYGADRVRNTPLCESSIIGVAIGLSLCGFRSMVEMQFADFVSCGFNQIVNNLAKLHYRWGHAPNVVVRLPCGGGVGAGPFHSQTMEAWFTHVPGLKIVYPSTPADAKGLLLSAFDDPNPVLFFEHKALYRRQTGPVTQAPLRIPFGVAALRSEGDSCTIVTYGAAVQWAIQAMKTIDGSADIIDLRTLCPIDYNTIEKSVSKTGRVLVLHEASDTGSFAGEIAAWIGEHCFQHLDAPVMRLGALDTPIPFEPSLENLYQPIKRLEHALTSLLEF